MSPAALASPICVSTCPSCGRPMRGPRQAAAPTTLPAPVDTRRMSYADLYRHYHRTAPVEDLRFFLRHAQLLPDLRSAGDALLAAGCRDTGGMLSRPDWYRRLTALHDRWRRETVELSSPEVSEALTGVA
jgi:hypothetical protein